MAAPRSLAFSGASWFVYQSLPRELTRVFLRQNPGRRCHRPLRCVESWREQGKAQRAGQVGMARTHPRHHPAAGAVRVFGTRRGIHDLQPVLPVAIANEHRDGRSERLAGAHAAQQLDVVLLDLHAPPAAVALLPPGELRVDVGGGQGQAGHHPLEDADERRAMGFAGGGEA